MSESENHRTHVYLVRHAHSEYVPDAERTRGLSKRGAADADRVTEHLLNEGIDVVVSGPYCRAVETVAGLAEEAGVEVVSDEGFRERRLAGEHVEDFEAAITELWRNPSFAHEGGESNVEARKRGIEALERLVDSHRGERVAVGTHGNLLTLVLGHYDDRYGFDFWRELAMPDVYRVTFEGDEWRGIEHVPVSDE